MSGQPASQWRWSPVSQAHAFAPAESFHEHHRTGLWLLAQVPMPPSSPSPGDSSAFEVPQLIPGANGENSERGAVRAEDGQAVLSQSPTRPGSPARRYTDQAGEGASAPDKAGTGCTQEALKERAVSMLLGDGKRPRASGKGRASSESTYELLPAAEAAKPCC